MKKILVVGSKRADASELEPVSMAAEYVANTIDAKANDVEMQYCQVDELVHVLDGNDTKVYLAENLQPLNTFDFVWFRGKLTPALNELAIVSQYLEKAGVAFANNNYPKSIAHGKLAQMYRLAELGLPYPKTIATIADNLPAAIARELTYPIILKATHGAHGNRNYLVQDEAHLQQILAKDSDVPFIAQTYIANDGDYRLLIIGDRQLIIHRKGSEGSHLNNTSQGGAATLVAENDFPTEVLADARRFATACNYAIAGVDVMFGTEDKEPYFLEANSQPQLMTGAFTDEKAALVKEFFLNKIN